MADNILAISYTERSLKDATVIKEYLLYKFTNKEVDHFYNLLQKFEKTVSRFPELYPVSKNSGRIRRAVLSKQLSVFYKETDNLISILAILDNRMNPEKWP